MFSGILLKRKNVVCVLFTLLQQKKIFEVILLPAPRFQDVNRFARYNLCNTEYRGILCFPISCQSRLCRFIIVLFAHKDGQREKERGGRGGGGGGDSPWYPTKAPFPLQPYRTETYRISLFLEHYRLELMTAKRRI